MLISNNPFECGFDQYVHLDSDVEFLGKESLKKIKNNGIKRKLMGVKINAKEINLTDINLLDKDNNIIGDLRSAAYSPTFDKIVGIAMIKIEFCKDKESFNMLINNKNVKGEICKFPII